MDHHRWRSWRGWPISPVISPRVTGYLRMIEYEAHRSCHWSACEMEDSYVAYLTYKDLKIRTAADKYHEWTTNGARGKRK